MPTIVKHADRVNRWIEAKQLNEQEMLRKLNELFNGEVPREKIADVTIPAVAAMWVEDRLHWEEHHCASPVVASVMSEEHDLPVWQLCTKEGRPLISAQGRLLRLWEMLREHDPTIKCDNLSELMRAIGAWLEKGGGFASEHMYEELRRRAPDEVKRRDPSGLRATAGAPLEQGEGFGTPDINRAFRVGPKKLPENPVQGLKALEWQKQLDEEAWGKDVRHRDKLEHEIEEHVRSAWVRPAYGKAGMQMKRADHDDLCRKIDLLFGLLVGATISGTTADTAIILEGLGAPRGLHAGYYLFPVATMAAALHHTLLEVALPLDLIGAVDAYSIGFYKTLKPKGGFPDELEPAEALLREGEDDKSNRHFVAWYDKNGAAQGCVQWHPDEYDVAKKTLYDAKGALVWAREMPRVPTEKDVVKLISKVSPLLFERLPLSSKAVAYS